MVLILVTTNLQISITQNLIILQVFAKSCKLLENNTTFVLSQRIWQNVGSLGGDSTASNTVVNFYVLPQTR